MKFLFVEDEVELLELYEIILDELDIDFKLAQNGAVALDLIKSEDFDFVFSDIRMPVMDGFELLKNIKKEELPIKSFVFITAHVDISKDEVQSKGAQDILYKPLGHRDLVRYINQLKEVTA